jgi:hypothetical protein
MEAQLLVSESHLSQQERRQMSLEDQRIHFGRYYLKVLQEFQKKIDKEQAIKMRRELEEARVRKIREETRNLIESYAPHPTSSRLSRLLLMPSSHWILG